MRKTAFVLLVALTLSGCDLFRSKVVEMKGPPYEPFSDAVDREYFHSPTGDIAGNYPKGWLLVNLEGAEGLEDILFAYTDPERSRALVLTEIPGTAELRRSVERDGLIALTEESFRRKNQARGGKLAIVRQPEIFATNGGLFVTYEYANADGTAEQKPIHRAAVFTTGVRFYELTLVELKGRTTPGSSDLRFDHIENFRLLQSVIGTLQGVARIEQAS